MPQPLWHKCMTCDTLYLSDGSSYYGFCSDACREAALKEVKDYGQLLANR